MPARLRWSSRAGAELTVRRRGQPAYGLGRSQSGPEQVRSQVADHASPSSGPWHQVDDRQPVADGLPLGVLQHHAEPGGPARRATGSPGR